MRFGTTHKRKTETGTDTEKRERGRETEKGGNGMVPQNC